MKKQFIILLSVIITEFIIVSALDKMNFQAKSPLENAIGVLLFLLPVQLLFFLLSKDQNLSKNRRLCFRIIFWFIILCYLVGAIAVNVCP